MPHSRFDLTGKIALVTGACRGIGRGIAVGLAEHGADVIIVDQSAPAQAQVVLAEIQKLGRRAWFIQQDLGHTNELHDLADRVWALASRIDILVNNAGVGFLERFNQITPQTWRRTLAVNLDAVFFLTQRLAEHMIAAGIPGRVINISSTNGQVAEAGITHYNTSKGGLELLTQSLAIELGPHDITVNALCPGMIETAADHDFPMDFRSFLDYFKQHVPLQHRLGTVEECVGATILFASPAGSYITGQHLTIDGGLLAEQVPRVQFMPPYKNTIRSGA